MLAYLAGCAQLIRLESRQIGKPAKGCRVRVRFLSHKWLHGYGFSSQQLDITSGIYTAPFHLMVGGRTSPGDGVKGAFGAARRAGTLDSDPRRGNDRL